MFEFKLDALREHRKRQEEMIQKELAEHKRMINQEKQKLSDLKLSEIKMESELQTKMESGLPLSESLMYSNYLKVLTGRIERQKEQLRKVGEAYKQRHDALIQASKKRKMLDKLKENRMKAFIDELNQNEQKTLDEIAVTLFQRKQIQKDHAESV